MEDNQQQGGFDLLFVGNFVQDVIHTPDPATNTSSTPSLHPLFIYL
jgi:hypothetical protein